MAKILNYYALCPINDVKEFLGLSQGAETGTIINTLGRNIISSVKVSTQLFITPLSHAVWDKHAAVSHFGVFNVWFEFRLQLSTQKQVNSWTSLDKFTNKVVYDCKSKQYVGVFAKKWIRCWSETCTDINKVKKIKVNRAQTRGEVKFCSEFEFFCVVSVSEANTGPNSIRESQYHCSLYRWHMWVIGIGYRYTERGAKWSIDLS